MKVRFPVFRGLLLVGVLWTGTCTIADETRRHGQCSGIDTRHDCIHLGELMDSVSVEGAFKSCTESESPVPLSAKEDPTSSIVHQFVLTRSGIVELEIDGLGDAWVLKEGTLILQTDENVSSVEHRFEPGRYTLIGRAPRCGNSKTDWNGRYKIRIDPHGAKGSSVVTRETINKTDEVVVLTREERKPTWRRIGMWTLIVSMALIGFFIFANSFSTAA